MRPSDGAETLILKVASNEEAIKILPAAIKYEEDVIIQPARPHLLPTEIFALLLTSAQLSFPKSLRGSDIQPAEEKTRKKRERLEANTSQTQTWRFKIWKNSKTASVGAEIL